MARVGKFAFFLSLFWELGCRSARGGMERAQGSPHSSSWAGLREETAKELTADIIVSKYMFIYMRRYTPHVCLLRIHCKPLAAALQPKPGPSGAPGTAPIPLEQPSPALMHHLLY